MKIILILLSLIGLLLTIAPSVLVLTGQIDTGMHKNLMTAGMVLWFGGAYFWINEERPAKSDSGINKE